LNTTKYIKEQILNLEYKLESNDYDEDCINELLEELYILKKNKIDGKRTIMNKLEIITIRMMDLPKNI
jgi:hypothetical protein